jgi:hypothetical protein
MAILLILAGFAAGVFANRLADWWEWACAEWADRRDREQRKRRDEARLRAKDRL